MRRLVGLAFTQNRKQKYAAALSSCGELKYHLSDIALNRINKIWEQEILPAKFMDGLLDKLGTLF